MRDKRLFLLDGNALVYRAHFAFITRPLVNSKGMNTSAVTGFVRSLWDIISNQKPSHIAISFDLSGPTFRNEMYQEYKAHREAQPEEITEAMPYIQEIIKGFNIPIITLENYEADDVIGTLSKQAEQEGFTVYMVTPDKDFSQLVSDNIFLYKPSRQGNGVEIMGIEEIKKKWDIASVDQVIDVLGLKGDSVDNIPGIPGIGPKTASTLLARFGSLEDIIANSDQLKGKTRERIETFAGQALLSKKLATITTDAPIQFDAEKYRLEDPDKDKLRKIFKELEFRTLSDAILGYEKVDEGVQQDLFGNPVKSGKKESPVLYKKTALAQSNIKNVDHDYQIVRSVQQVKELAGKLAKEKMFCFDCESTGLDSTTDKLLGLSISFTPHKAYYISCRKEKEEAVTLLQPLQNVFADSNIEKIGQNIKFDIVLLRRYDLEIGGRLRDTMIAHYLLEPEKKHNMDYLSETYLDYAPISITSLIGKRGKKQLSLDQIDPDKVAEYAAEDADVTLRLEQALFPQLDEYHLSDLYNKVEGPLVYVLADLEYEGVNIDVPFLNNYSIKLAELVAREEKIIYEMAGVRFNIASPRQVGEVLFEKLKIPYRWRKTKTGQHSTDEDKMNELAKNHDIVRHILQHRMYSKLKSTYVDALPLLINPHTNRLHSSFNQALAATGRLSSNNPNLQNIPIRTEEGRRIREAFIPRDEDHILLSADYSQIELRLIAEISKEEAMLEAFSNEQDIHRATAAAVYGVDYEQVTPDQRRNAKTVNFSIIYGAGATNLSRQLDIKRDEANNLIRQYFKQYQGLKKYMEDTVEFARKHGYVSTLMGRRRFVYDINSTSSFARSGAERIAINTPIQGTAADMIKMAMVNIHRKMTDQGLRSKMILQVHDELVFDVHIPEKDQLSNLVEEEMKNALPELKVPIVVGMGFGKNWLEAH